MQSFPIRGRAAALALVGAASVLLVVATTAVVAPTEGVALAADLAQSAPCPTPTVDVSQIGVGPSNVFGTPTPVPMCPAPNPVLPPTATLQPSAPTPQQAPAAPITAPAAPTEGGSPHVGPLPEPASAEVQANPAGEMPPPAPERDPANEPTPPANAGPPPGELALGEYGACFSYGLTMSFTGLWQTVTVPTTIYIAIEPGNQYTAFALGNDGVTGSFSYDPGTGELVWLDGTFQSWPSSALVDANGRTVIHVKEVSAQGVVTTYRCPLG